MTRALELLRTSGEKSTRTSVSNPRAVLDRTEFLARLDAANHVQRATLTSALLLLDINDFQSVNDAFGTNAADSVLDIVANRLLAAVPAGALVGRLGGDRFGILAGVRSEDDAVRLGRKLLTLVASPICACTYDVALTGRVGISLLGEQYDAADCALRHATTALRKARVPSALRAVVCAPAVSDPFDKRAAIRREVGHLLDMERLRLVYQPIVSLSDQRIVGYEALLRWRMPDGTQVSEEFVAVAESLGLIEQIGRWALDETIGRLSELEGGNSGLDSEPIMAVNLSARQFADPTLVEHVARSLTRHDTAPSRLALEITESLAVNDPGAKETIGALRNLGCHVGLDDFGTGQSCLSYLRSLPIDFIKIDRTFVAEVVTDEKARCLIQTIIRMAHDLGHCTVAEGIEDHVQMDSLQQAGCSFGQGYLFGYPGEIRGG